jgi:isopentenyl diphosphate isomerase/L-lactate dehydrogenase-like FMN-dependent dehydrogenase
VPGGRLLNLDDYEAAAAASLPPEAFGFYAGGADDEISLRDNRAAFARRRLRPRVLVDVSGTTTGTTVLGDRLELPVLVAPVAFQRLAHPDGELAVARAARAAGTVMCLSTNATAAPAEVAPIAGRCWFQSYVFRDAGRTRALVLTVDSPRRGHRERDLRQPPRMPEGMTLHAHGGARTPVEAHESVSASLTWADVESLAAESRLPIVLKGILTAEDAAIACRHDVAAVIVSNHGGRQLDGVRATLDALPEVAEAVGGRIEILLDGGVRRGTDVLKAIALGARAVLIGRPLVWGLAVDGEHGAAHVLELLREELLLSLMLLGCTSPDGVSADHIDAGRAVGHGLP